MPAMSRVRWPVARQSIRAGNALPLQELQHEVSVRSHQLRKQFQLQLVILQMLRSEPVTKIQVKLCWQGTDTSYAIFWENLLRAFERVCSLSVQENKSWKQRFWYQVRKARWAVEDSEQGLWEQVSWERDWNKEESEESACDGVSVRAMQSDWVSDSNSRVLFCWDWRCIYLWALTHIKIKTLYNIQCTYWYWWPPPPYTAVKIRYQLWLDTPFFINCMIHSYCDTNNNSSATLLLMPCERALLLIWIIPYFLLSMPFSTSKKGKFKMSTMNSKLRLLWWYYVALGLY